MVLSGLYVNRHDSRTTRPLDLDLVPRAGPDRARRSIHALRAQTPRGGDHRPFLVIPPRSSLQGAGAPGRVGSVDRRARGGGAAEAAPQLAVHRAALARYEEDRRAERGLNGSDSAARTVEHWRGVTLPMGLLYERAAVEFWERVYWEGAADDARR